MMSMNLDPELDPVSGSMISIATGSAAAMMPEEEER